MHVIGLDNQVGSREALFGQSFQESKDWHGTASPVVGRLSDVSNTHGQASKLVLSQHTSSVAHSAAEGAIKHAGVARSALVAEEMGYRRKSTTVVALSLAQLELLVNQVGNELLGVDLRELDGASHLALNKQLLLHELGEGLEKRVGPGSQQSADVSGAVKQFLR